MTDSDSFSAFMDAALPGLLRFGHVLTGDPHRAEELVQAALVKTWSRWSRVDPARAHAYVRTAMVNTHTSWWRRSRRETALPPGYDAADPSGAHARCDDRDRAMQALMTLPVRQRAVLVLRYYEDLSEADIAATLGCSTGTVKSQASRALHALRERLEPLDDPTPQGAVR